MMLSFGASLATGAVPLKESKRKTFRPRRYFCTRGGIALFAALLLHPRPLASLRRRSAVHDASWPCALSWRPGLSPRHLHLLRLRGGAGRGGAVGLTAADLHVDDLTGLQDSSNIPSEGTAPPGAGVVAEEGYIEKRKKELASWHHGSEEDQRLEREVYPSWEDAVIEREKWFAKNPGFVEPLNDTWFFEVRKGNLTCISELVQKGAQVEWIDEFGNRAIHLAAKDENLKLLLLIISLGADVNARNKLGNTALHLATERAHIEMMGALIDEGADVEKRNLAKATALITACVHGHVECIRLLAKAGADVHTRAFKGTPALHLAAAGDHAGAIRALVELGVDVNATTPLGRNAMDWAYYSNEMAAMAELEKHRVPVQDGGMLPELEIKKWAIEKRQRYEATQAARAKGMRLPVRELPPDGWFQRGKEEALVLAPMVLPRTDEAGNQMGYPSDLHDLVQEA